MDDRFICSLKDQPDNSELQSICRVCLESLDTYMKLYPLQGPVPNCDREIYQMITYCVAEEVSY